MISISYKMQTDASIQSTSALLLSNFISRIERTLTNEGILHQFIQKKTKRGRKCKNELPKDEKCQLCLEFVRFSLSELVKCKVCKVEFHSSCYKHPIKNSSSFICERCEVAKEEGKSIESYKCFICNRCDGVLYHQALSGEFYHQLCRRFIPELCEDCTEDGVTKHNIRRWRYKNSCKYCREKLSQSKAVIKCSNPKCKCYYHVPCAIQKGMIFSMHYFMDYFEIRDHTTTLPFFCSSHNKRLTAAYRNDIIYHKNDCSSTKTELSAKDTTEEISSEDGNDNENDYVYNNDNEELLFAPGSNALNLNFDEMIDNEESQWRPECSNMNINYISPKSKIHFDFNYQDTTDNEFPSPFDNAYIYEINF